MAASAIRIAAVGMLGISSAAAATAAATAQQPSHPVWPPPLSLLQRGVPALVSANLTIDVVTTSGGSLSAIESARLARAIDRTASLLRQRAGKTPAAQRGAAMPTLLSVQLRVGNAAGDDGAIDETTDYSYDLSVDAVAGTAVVTAPSSA
jgi:hypothetical protein